MTAPFGNATHHEVRIAEGTKPRNAVRIAVLSDLHVHHRENLDQVPELARSIREASCDVVVLAGDVSHRFEEIEACLSHLLVAREHVFVPGNHDLWPVEDGRPNSRERHELILPEMCHRLGWKYLPLDGPVPFGAATFFGVGGWPDGTLVGPALEATGACEWEPREPDSILALQDAARLRAQISRHQSNGAHPSALVLVTHFPASGRAGELVEKHGKAMHAKDGQRLLESVWLAALEGGAVGGPPDLLVHGHKHGRYFEGDTVCWAFGYPWEAVKLGQMGAPRFAALDLVPTRNKAEF